MTEEPTSQTMTPEPTAPTEAIIIAGGDDRFRKITERSAKEARRGKLFRTIVRTAFLLAFATAVSGMYFNDKYPILIWPAGISILLLIPLLPLAVFSGAFIPGHVRIFMNKRDEKAYKE